MSIIDTPDWSSPGGSSGSATIGQPTPLVATVVAGSDGTDVWAIATDESGHIIPMHATPGPSGHGGGGANIITILSPPAGGYNYVFGIDVSLGSGGTPGPWTLYDDDAGYPIAIGYAVANSAEHVVLHGEKILDHLKLQCSDAGINYCVRYTVGP